MRAGSGLLYGRGSVTKRIFQPRLAPALSRILCVASLTACCALAQSSTPNEDVWRKNFVAGVQAVSQNDSARAETLFGLALHAAEAFGPSDPRLGSTLNSLGLVYHARGKYRDAERVYLRAVRNLDKAYGGQSLDVANVCMNMAHAYMDERQYAPGERYLRYALPIFEKTLGSESLKTGRALFDLGEIDRLTGRYAEAVPLLKRAAAIREKAQGPRSPEAAEALNRLALVYQALGKSQESAKNKR